MQVPVAKLFSQHERSPVFSVGESARHIHSLSKNRLTLVIVVEVGLKTKLVDRSM